MRAQALEKAQEGLAHYRAERWREACDSFREAERLFAAPSVMIYRARCEGKLGNTAEARRLYERILAAPPAKDAPAPYVEAYRDAEKELAALPAAVESPREAAAPPPPSHPPPSAGSRLLGFITLGVGAVGLGIGAATGALSLSRVSDLEARCGGYRCTPAEEPDAHRAKTLGTISTAAFVVGGVAAAAGVVLLVIRPGGAQVPRRRAPRPLLRRCRASASVWAQGGSSSRRSSDHERSWHERVDRVERGRACGRGPDGRDGVQRDLGDWQFRFPGRERGRAGRPGRHGVGER